MAGHFGFFKKMPDTAVYEICTHASSRELFKTYRLINQDVRKIATLILCERTDEESIYYQRQLFKIKLVTTPSNNFSTALQVKLMSAMHSRYSDENHKLAAMLFIAKNKGMSFEIPEDVYMSSQLMFELCAPYRALKSLDGEMQALIKKMRNSSLFNHSKSRELNILVRYASPHLLDIETLQVTKQVINYSGDMRDLPAYDALRILIPFATESIAAQSLNQLKKKVEAQGTEDRRWELTRHLVFSFPARCFNIQTIDEIFEQALQVHNKENDQTSLLKKLAPYASHMKIMATFMSLETALKACSDSEHKERDYEILLSLLEVLIPYISNEALNSLNNTSWFMQSASVNNKAFLKAVIKLGEQPHIHHSDINKLFKITLESSYREERQAALKVMVSYIDAQALEDGIAFILAKYNASDKYLDELNTLASRATPSIVDRFIEEAKQNKSMFALIQVVVLAPYASPTIDVDLLISEPNYLQFFVSSPIATQALTACALQGKLKKIDELAEALANVVAQSGAVKAIASLKAMTILAPYISKPKIDELLTLLQPAVERSDLRDVPLHSSALNTFTEFTRYASVEAIDAQAQMIEEALGENLSENSALRAVEVKRLANIVRNIPPILITRVNKKRASALIDKLCDKIDAPDANLQEAVLKALAAFVPYTSGAIREQLIRTGKECFYGGSSAFAIALLSACMIEHDEVAREFIQYTKNNKHFSPFGKKFALIVELYAALYLPVYPMERFLLHIQPALDAIKAQADENSGYIPALEVIQGVVEEAQVLVLTPASCERKRKLDRMQSTDMYMDEFYDCAETAAQELYYDATTEWHALWDASFRYAKAFTKALIETEDPYPNQQNKRGLFQSTTPADSLQSVYDTETILDDEIGHLSKLSQDTESEPGPAKRPRKG